MHNQTNSPKLLRYGEILYLFLIGVSFYLLLASRTGEARTIWEVLHPAFIPTLLFTTILLVAILLSSEKAAYKILFVMFISVLLHSFFPIVFPAGDLSGQQITLGRIRSVYDNFEPLTLTSPSKPLLSPLYDMFRGDHFQAALSVVLARMFSLDIFEVHLFFVPVLWGLFVPLAAFFTTRALGGSDNASALSSLLLSAFPYTTYFGAISVPNSLGFIFFFCSFPFILQYLEARDSKSLFLMLAFSFFSFLSHFLTGIMSVSLILLAFLNKSHKGEEKTSSLARAIVSIVFCASLLPLSLVYFKFFRANSYAVFSMEKLVELPIKEILGLSLFGDLIYSLSVWTAVLIVIGPALAFLCMVYLLYKLRKNHNGVPKATIKFAFLVFLVISADYIVLKLFMDRLPFSEERLWVFRDFIAAPFAAQAIYMLVLQFRRLSDTESLRSLSINRLRTFAKTSALRSLGMLTILNIIVPSIVAGWLVLSLSAAYPQVAPLQTTQYELDAVKYVEEYTREKYVVICDVWTIYAGEVMVGISNPSAYYFDEYSQLGHDLFANMSREPSAEWMLSAMNRTGTDVAYFIVSEPRLNPEKFNSIVASIKEPLSLFYVSPNKKLYVFSYRKSI
jgi:hypothetical protein